MVLSATRPADPNRHSQISDHAKKLQIKIQNTWGEMLRRKWPMVFIEKMDKNNVSILIEKFLLLPTKCRNGDILLSQKNQLVEIISSHQNVGNPFFVTSILRGIYHAVFLGCDVQHCLTKWVSRKVDTTSDLIEQMLLTFELDLPRNETNEYSGPRCRTKDKNNTSRFGSLLGHSLSLLFVARHGLHENELFDLLGRVQEQSSWNNKTKGTVVPVKIKILKMLMQKKERLIDVFRSFDTDGNGTLSHDEFYKGMQRLEINATHEEVAQLIREVDNNGDGEIDYR